MMAVHSDWHAQPSSAIPDHDDETLAMLRRGETIGVFQLESPALRSLLIKLPLRGLDDLTTALALVRPGPAAGDAKAAFIRRAHHQEPAVVPHPLLAPLLRASHGLLLYEEDIIRIVAAVTTWSLERADVFRARVQHEHHDPSALAPLRCELVAAAGAAGVPHQAAHVIMDQIVAFAAYSFSKAHAASYTLLAWRAAYLKAHHLPFFGCALLDHHGGLYPLRALGAELVRRGVRLLPPSVNFSERRCQIDRERGGIRIGLDRVKHLSDRSKRALLTSRARHASPQQVGERTGPFRSVADLLNNVSLSHRELRALVLSGACDDLEPLASGIYPWSHEELVALHQHGTRPEELAEKTPKHVVPATPADAARMQRYARLVRVRYELETMDLHVTEHPMQTLRAEARRLGCITTADIPDHVDRFVRLAAIVSATRRLLSKRNAIMQFITLDDEMGTCEAVLFPHVYAALRDPVTTPGPFLIEGRVENDHGDAQLVIARMVPFYER